MRDFYALIAFCCAAPALAACASQPAAPVPAPAPVAAATSGTPAAPVAAGSVVAVAPSSSAAVRPEPATASTAAAAPPRSGALASYLKGLKDVSCPTGVGFEAPEPIAIAASPVPLAVLAPGKKTVGALAFVAGFHLTSPDKRFGGLSDMHFLPDGGLLTVSDVGNFVWLDLGPDGITPVAARIAPLRDDHGEALTQKVNADAEGLAVNGGMALVSFERNHRVLAYDLGDCGAAARGAPIVHGGHGLPMPDAFAAAGLEVPANHGLEALAVTPDWFMFTGVEQEADGSGPLSARPIEAPPRFDLRIEKGAPDLVAIDLLPAGGKAGGKAGDVRAFTLHRGFSSLLGNAIAISETRLARRPDPSANRASEADRRARWRYRVTDSRRLAEMNIVLTIDNFEGMAAKQLPDGTVRLFVISDDNFSSSQRTLLMIYDLPPDG